MPVELISCCGTRAALLLAVHYNLRGVLHQASCWDLQCHAPVIGGAIPLYECWHPCLVWACLQLYLKRIRKHSNNPAMKPREL